MTDTMVLILILFAFMHTAIDMYTDDYERGKMELYGIMFAILIISGVSTLVKYDMEVKFRKY